MNGVQAVHEFHVWRLVGERIIATVHIRFSDLKAYLAAADEIRTLFHDNSIHSTTIQPEFSEVGFLGFFFLTDRMRKMKGFLLKAHYYF